MSTLKDETWRFDPFNEVITTVTQTEYFVIEEIRSGIFGVQSVEGILKELSDYVVCREVINADPDAPTYGTTYSEVDRTIAPSASQYRIDYDQLDLTLSELAGYYNTGIVEFHSSLVGTMIEIVYKGTGRLCLREEGLRYLTSDNTTTYHEAAKNFQAGILTTTGLTTIANVDINGGSIDNTPVGANSWTTGKFTTCESTGLMTAAGFISSSVDINGGNIDATIIGATSHTSAKFTTIETSGKVGIGGSIPSTSNMLVHQQLTAINTCLELGPVSGHNYNIGRDDSSGFMVFKAQQSTFSGYEFWNDSSVLMKIDNSGDIYLSDNNNLELGGTGSMLHDSKAVLGYDNSFGGRPLFLRSYSFSSVTSVNFTSLSNLITVIGITFTSTSSTQSQVDVTDGTTMHFRQANSGSSVTCSGIIYYMSTS